MLPGEAARPDRLDRVRERVTVGVGGGYGRLEEIARSARTLAARSGPARRLGRAGSVVVFDELGIHRLLLQVADLANGGNSRTRSSAS